MQAPPPNVSAIRGGYDLHPVHRVPFGAIGQGFEALAAALVDARTIRIDGYIGVDWEDFRRQLNEQFAALGRRPAWIDVSQAWHSPAEIDRLVEPYLGGDDPLFGTRFPGTLHDFIDAHRWQNLRDEAVGEFAAYYGCGAALVDAAGPVVYVDLPKDELQLRSREGRAGNLGVDEIAAAKEQYKRYYFVDWPILNRHKAEIMEQVNLIVDGQDEQSPSFLQGDAFRTALDELSRNVFRVRPWFAPGPWGGQWLKQHVPAAPQDVPNYAWSFEIIAPENGIVLSDGGSTVEATVDWLLYYRQREVLGDCADRFGYEFPIRFDFLDTVDGGNLSVQCHPRPDYIREQFGETFTQDETYYILDCRPGAEVYLGFQAGVDPGEFRDALETSVRDATPVDVERYVAVHPAAKHDLFLIPHGTIHCSGAGNLVLEISATPYIFTFKMYDWLRSDLDGKPRPLNIERAFDNLDFSRQGDLVAEDLICRPFVIDEGQDWRLVHLPTHRDHFYDVHRHEFDTAVEVETAGSPHVLMLVEGTRVTVETRHGVTQRFQYAETFVIPAAAESYRLINNGPERAMVVKAFIKPNAAPRS
ncbi:MAG: class I mannose-6-phosphate isomerase [Planctomycetales bacterium]|nr:class I mannose-6-phosphate isomerase [Planctomycetales bacterium]